MHFVAQPAAFVGHDFAATRQPFLPCELSLGSYRSRLAVSDEERRAIYRLRFLVFNLELNEGLESGYDTGMDMDEFDRACDHIYVEHVPTGAVIGTYRVQTGDSAAEAIGYYSEREFDFAPYDPLRHELLELGRACIHRDHRSFEVLSLLWKAIGAYATVNRSRYLIGCSSLTSQDPVFGWSVYHHLANYRAEPHLLTTARSGFSLATSEESTESRPPKLLRAYLSIGARICSTPALDREFKTIDFLTLLDIKNLSASARAHFFPQT
jgi:putative hemolysin